MSATSWTSRHTASNRSTVLPKGSGFAMLLLLLLTFSAFLAACIVLEFWVFMLLLERVLREIAEEREEQEFQFFMSSYRLILFVCLSFSRFCLLYILQWNLAFLGYSSLKIARCRFWLWPTSKVTVILSTGMCPKKRD